MVIESDGFDRLKIAQQEAIFHTANGYIGVRNCPEEGVQYRSQSIRGAYINAFYDTEPIRYAEKLHGFPDTAEHMVNVTDVQSIALYAGNERFSPSGGLLGHTRVLDMENGLAIRSISWRTSAGNTIALCIKRMASFVMKNLFLLEFCITSLDYSGGMTVVSSQDGNVKSFSDPDDPRVPSNGDRRLITERLRAVEDSTIMQSKTVNTELTMASAVRHVCTLHSRIDHKLASNRADTVISIQIEPGQTAVIQKFCIFTDGRRFDDPAGAALKLLDEAVRYGAAYWYKKQQELLDGFWRHSRIVIEGDEAAQRLMDFNVYQLLQSAGSDRLSNIPAKGLSGEGYEGHYFWDTEIYMFPFFLLTDRKTARSLLSYRYHILDEARRHARDMGHQKGALYPWRTIAGRECSSYYPSGSAQYHINGDVAHSVLSYYAVTNDMDYLAEEGAEILFETARLWLDVGHYGSDGRFRIDCVTGPDEYTCIVNNNFYTNSCARENLFGAVSAYCLLCGGGMENEVRRLVAGDEIEAFKHAAERMYLPYDDELGIIAQDDSFLQKARWDISSIPPGDFPLLLNYHPLYINRHQICKQADTVLAAWLFDEDMDDAVIERTFDYYEPITTHDSSLSACVFSIVASRLGRLERAYDYFKKAVATDMEDIQGNTKHGLHIANMGGAWLAVTAGFAGLRIRENGLHFRPRCPKNWKSFAFKLQYRESEFQITINTNTAVFILLSGPPVPIFISGNAYYLKDELTVEVSGGHA
ncbi:MAG: Alpha,alpha-trehalose phosphorylase [Firmicutes bacterium ADurb.Bin182]|nr:MAG: Alpha,alpha-trehalose phosphorylase [Firmicutes bacterium ADurb.Bin182]